jgi:hypothetical protein
MPIAVGTPPGESVDLNYVTTKRLPVSIVRIINKIYINPAKTAGSANPAQQGAQPKFKQVLPDHREGLWWFLNKIVMALVSIYEFNEPVVLLCQNLPLNSSRYIKDQPPSKVALGSYCQR